MDRIEPYIELWGESFTPSQVDKENGSIFSESQNPGEIGFKGKYRDKPIPFGSATISIKHLSISGNEKIKEVCTLYLQNAEKIKASGCTDIYLHLSFFSASQNNFELSEGDISLISKLNCPVTISFIHEEES